MTSRAKTWIPLIAMSGALAMTFIDETGVGVALPTIQRELSTSATELLWIVNAYMLSFAALVALGGRISDFFGHSRIFVIGILTFTVGSVGSGVAPDEIVLITMRALQGVGAALMVPTAVSIVSELFPPEQRGRAIGSYIGIASIFYLVGPVLGGLLTQLVSWRLIFLINPFIALAILGVVAMYIPGSNRKLSESVDLKGAVALIIALTTLVFALVQSGVWEWSSLAIIILLCASILFFCLFWWLENRSSKPLFNLKIMMRSSVASGITIVFLVYIVYVGLIIYGALYLQHIVDLRPAESGLLISLALSPIIAAAPLGGILMDKIGVRTPALLGAIVGTLSFTILAVTADTKNLAFIAPALFLYGISIPVTYSITVTACQNLISDTERGQISGFIVTAAQGGAAIGVAVLGAILASNSDATSYSVEKFRAIFFISAGICLLMFMLVFPLTRSQQSQTSK